MSEWSDGFDDSPMGITSAVMPASLGLAKPVAAPAFVSPAEGGFEPRAASESSVAFLYLEEWQEIALVTSGFEGFEEPEPEAAVEPAATAIEPQPPVAVIPPVATVPVEIITPPAAIRFSEPLEIMDYEEFDPYYEEPAVEPEPEPEPEPPAFVVAPLAVAVNPMGPAPAKPMAPVGALLFAEAQPVLIDAVFPTVRPKIVRGPDPNAKVVVPEPTPEPAPAPAPAAEPVAVVEAPAPPPPPPAPEKPKVTVRPAPPAEKGRRPARDHGNAVPVEREVPPPPAPAPKPKVMPMPARRPEVAPEPMAPAAAARVDTAPMIGMPVESAGGMSNGVKMAVAGAVLAVLSAGGYFVFGGKSEKVTTGADATATSLIVGGGGWTTTWGNDAAVNKNKQISIYRPSMAMTDYRFEFRGQIERKALGWIFRASNSKNYYVMKLETMKPGPQPLVALVKYAVVDGKETTRTQVMLPFDVKLDTVYSVRLDVSGDKFSTYVQDKLVDFWNDGRIKVGGAGFYSDAGERASIKSSQLSYLTTAAK